MDVSLTTSFFNMWVMFSGTHYTICRHVVRRISDVTSAFSKQFYFQQARILIVILQFVTQQVLSFVRD